MHVLLFPALLLLATACTGTGPLGGLDCGRFSPNDGDVLVLGQTPDGGYTSYENVMTWDVVEHSFTLGSDSFTEDVLHSSSAADAVYADGGATEWEQDTWMRCDSEGVWLVDSAYRGSTVYDDGQTFEVDQHTEYNTASFLRPLSPEVGDTWERGFDYTVVSADPSAEPTVVDMVWTDTVTDDGELTTPAGTFDAIEVTTETSGSTFIVWYGEGVGFLQSDSTELAEIR